LCFVLGILINDSLMMVVVLACNIIAVPCRLVTFVWSLAASVGFLQEFYLGRN
jgi:hypothetical protein